MKTLSAFVRRWQGRGSPRRRLGQFRRELAVARESRRPEAVAALAARRSQLDLSEDDVALELELIDALLESWGLETRLAGGDDAPRVETQHRAIAGEACYFLASVGLPDSDSHETGKLFFTESRCVFTGLERRSIGWRKVKAIREEDRDLVIVADGDALRFRCNTYVEVMRGLVVGRWLLARGERQV